MDELLRELYSVDECVTYADELFMRIVNAWSFKVGAAVSPKKNAAMFLKSNLTSSASTKIKRDELEIPEESDTLGNRDAYVCARAEDRFSQIDM